MLTKGGNVLNFSCAAPFPTEENKTYGLIKLTCTRKGLRKPALLRLLLLFPHRQQQLISSALTLTEVMQRQKPATSRAT